MFLNYVKRGIGFRKSQITVNLHVRSLMLPLKAMLVASNYPHRMYYCLPSGHLLILSLCLIPTSLLSSKVYKDCLKKTNSVVLLHIKLF